LQKLFPPREPFNAYSHYLGALIALAWLILLMFEASEDSTGRQISFFVYGVSVILMFLSSAIYHSLNVQTKVEELFRMFDHILIYVVIAGTYTPMCVILLKDGWQLGMVLGIWLFALGGILKKIFWLNAPRWFSTLIYLLMGWVSVIILPMIWNIMPHDFIYWIGIGGVFYTVGAVIYAIKKPDPYPKVFGFHEIWHLFVMGGAFSHFWAIYYYLPGLNYPA
jgi:hemolysin III